MLPTLSPVDIQSHLYNSLLESRTADVALRVRGNWEALYRLHRVVLIQAVSLISLVYSSCLIWSRGSFDPYSRPASLNPNQSQAIVSWVRTKLTSCLMIIILHAQVPDQPFYHRQCSKELLLLAFECVHNCSGVELDTDYFPEFALLVFMVVAHLSMYHRLSYQHHLCH